MKIKRLFLILILFSIPLFLLVAEEEAHSAETETVYVIRGVDYTLKGRTRPSALFYYGEFVYGERIEGREKLDRYLVLKEQLIINRRTHDEVSVTYTLGHPEEDGALPVYLMISAEDTWNIIALPEPKYDSNEGFSLTLKARDYNFLGTMNPLRFDLGYLYSTKDHENKHVFNFTIDSDTPFYAAGLRWNLNFDHVFDYTPDDPLYYKNVTGISVEVPSLLASTFVLGIDQYMNVNEANSQANMDKYGLGERFDGAYAATEFYGNWKIPVGINFANYGQLAYTPRISYKIAYRPGGIDSSRKPVFTFGHTLGFGRVNWIGNYRHGLDVSLGNTNYFYSDPDDNLFNISARISMYHRFNKFIGVSVRMQYRHWFNDLHYDAAGVIRGIPTSDLRAENMLSLNMDIPFRLLRFAPSVWFDNRKLRLFNFDLHLSPFFDMAFLDGYFNYPKERDFENTDDTRITFTDGVFGGGFELIVFPDFFRSLYLRISVGYNLNNVFETGNIPKWDELFIGIGHHY